MTTANETKTLKNFINGEWTTPSGTDFIDIVNPADTREVVAHVQQSTADDAAAALTAAEEAFKTWKKVPSPQRGEYLYKIAAIMEEEQEELANIIVKEEGKTYADALKEIVYAAGIVKFYAGEGRRMTGRIIESDMPNVQIETHKEALGVILVVTPWNFPLSIPVWKIAPAILCGNTVVLKASSETPLTASKFMEIIQKAGVPAGVVNQIVGPGRLVTEMIHHPAVKGITFTGSNRVGNLIYQEASKDMKRVLLEMGGKNPLIVMEDADIETAVQLAAAGGFGQTGQACTATGRVIVHKDIIKEFTEKLVARAKEIKVGNGFEEGVDIGPQVSEGERQSTLDLVKKAVEEGAEVLVGGGIPQKAGTEHGYFVEPTVIGGVTSSMTIGQEEVFGPVISIIETSNIDEAIEIANDIAFGLSASICTKNLSYMTKALNEIQAGIVKVNMTTTGTFFQAPFGGYKQSSTGTYKELGSEAVEFYCQNKTRYINSN
ncbi:aldehyde dehydrogenase family protein [Domibacillus mangrovi]|uniref:3-sulfolactaldehyde dehydrogenase n=1 Tax=Domibacillus mangrovi TaxID=1714354 RepID=A0A1Q5P2V6_9BACI|nr:aldehyde dehydrogenase family protein [Domibacillus mangrovi]OKL36528.1 aldehyde dehydrogenase [Domibacillus mangrovi]